MVHDTTSLGQPGGPQLPEVTLPLSTLRHIPCFARYEHSAVRIPAFSIPRRRWSSYHSSVMHGRLTKFHLLHLQLPLNALSLHGNLSGEQGDYAQDVYIYHLVNAATALAKTADREVGAHNPVQDIIVGFGLDRLRMNVYCKEASGSVVFTDPAAEDEEDLDSLPETVDFGQRSFITENERAHYSELKDRYRQRRQLVGQLSTLNSREKLTATEVRLLTKSCLRRILKSIVGSILSLLCFAISRKH